MKIIAGLKLNDDTPPIQKLQLCMALAKGVLDLKPGERPERFVREECAIADAISNANWRAGILAAALLKL